MASGAALNKKYKICSLKNLIGTLLFAVIGAMIAGTFANRIALQSLEAGARETLAVQTEALTGMLDKYRLLPVLIASAPQVVGLFSGENTDRANAARLIATHIAGRSGALDLTILNVDGSQLAAGLGVFTDHINSDSPLIFAAQQGRLGREVRLLENGRLAYVFMSPVRKDNEILGFVAVYVGLEELEATWSLSNNPVLAVDDGKIILSNREDWRDKMLSDVRKPGPNPAYFDFNGAHRRHLAAAQEIPLLDWKLCVLADTGPADVTSKFWAVFTSLLTMAFGAVYQALLNNQIIVSRRERKDRAIALRLERVVRERTRALVQMNQSLEREIREHQLADEQLRQTQNELVQTGKLAALGQMSTALAHEYNQPLAAVKSYADNAVTYLERGRFAEVRNNISSISDLTDRMATISKHLKNFARKPNQTYTSVQIRPVIEDALSVLASRIDSSDAKITLVEDETEIWVRGGHVRLQQVIVNVIINSLDALHEQPRPQLSIKTGVTGNKVIITIADNGPGIAEDVIDTLFDPFVTTKDVGRGLGLGLSISYNIIKDFGGQLSAANKPEGGARFSIILDKGTLEQAAAE